MTKTKLLEVTLNVNILLHTLFISLCHLWLWCKEEWSNYGSTNADLTCWCHIRWVNMIFQNQSDHRRTGSSYSLQICHNNCFTCFTSLDDNLHKLPFSFFYSVWVYVISRLMNSGVTDDACTFNAICSCTRRHYSATTLFLVGEKRDSTALTLSVPHFSDCNKMSLPNRSGPYWSNPPFLNFWHSGSLALSPERQRARMSKIKKMVG